MRSKWIWLSAVLVVCLSVGWWLFKRSRVSTVHPKRGDLQEAVYGLGKVKTDKRYEVIVGILTTVKKIFVEEGQSVKAGDMLLQLDSASFFRAPFDGVITFIKVREGETATPSVALMRLEDLRTRYIELSLDQEAALRVSVGQQAKVSFETLREKILSAQVSSLYSRNDEFIAHVRVEGLDPSILPGMTADVTVEVGKISNALLIPVRAVQGGVITVRRNGRWVKEKIELGYVDGAFGEVRGGQLDEDSELRVQAGE